MSPDRLELSVFGRALEQAGNTGLVWFGEDCMWQARIETANGVFELAKPGGTIGYARLERLLSLFAGVGIRRITVEWENFPAFYLDRVN